MSDTQEKFDSAALHQQATDLADSVMNDYDLTVISAWEAAREVCEGHEWAIYTYKAIMVCAENDYSEAEATMQALDPRGYNFSDHASGLACHMLFNKVLEILDERGVEI